MPRHRYTGGGGSDHKVITAFIDQRPADGPKLWTDGKRLDGHWLGGARIAEWIDGQRGLQIVFHDLGSKAAQTVQRAVRRHAAPYMLAEWIPRKRGARR